MLALKSLSDRSSGVPDGLAVARRKPNRARAAWAWAPSRPGILTELPPIGDTENHRSGSGPHAGRAIVAPK